MFDFFKKIFHERSEGGWNSDSPTVQVNTGDLLTINPEKTRLPYQVATCQSVGKERTHNEDTLFVVNTYLDGIDPGLALGLYIVADGMGGHQSGEIASHLAVQGAGFHLLDQLLKTQIFERKGFTEQEVQNLLNEAVEQAQKMICQRVPGGGTTLTLALILGDRMFTAHIGDSRLYVLSQKGKLNLFTKDHSLVKRLVDLGEITEADAATHPQRNVLYRALGQTDALEPDLNQTKLAAGDLILICSDGLWGTVDKNELKSILEDGGLSLDQKASTLVDAANQAGGPDNISVVLVKRIV
ncbi:MAG: serine/threonine-protein phosphatase [Anaerolineaceae bacterium]|nr:serine/threonine-protein phosphatase [Anaerolineaceae bacterium]